MGEEDFPRGKAPPAVVKAAAAAGGGGGGKPRRKIPLEELGKLEETAKPRGGGKLDNLFADVEPKVKSSEGKAARKRKKGQLTAEELMLLGGKRGRKEAQSFQVLPLTYDTLIKDLLSLGVVLQVHSDSLIICLPNHTTGKVIATRISAPYTAHLKKAAKKGTPFTPLSSLFWVGQLVVVKVLEVGVLPNGKGHRDVQLSLDPRDIHANLHAQSLLPRMMLVGAVQSEEEKGWQVDLGVAGLTAFLPHGEKIGEELKIGQLIYLRVSSVQGRAVQVTMRLEKKQPTQNELQEGGVNYTALLPSMTLETFVVETHETGVKLGVDQTLEALCHVDHLVKETPAPAEDLMTRVLYLHPNLTTPYVTARLNLIPTRTTLKETAGLEGVVVEGRVTGVSARGINLRLGEGGQRAFLPLGNLEGIFTSKEDLEKKWKKGHQTTVRVLKWSPFEDLYVCTAKKDMVHAPYLRAGQVTPGTVVRVKVIAGDEHGVRVQFPPGKMEGWVPRCLMSAGLMKSLAKGGFSTTPGGKGGKAARVMEWDGEKGRLVLTFLKKMVDSKGKVVTSLGEAKAGWKGEAVVVHVTEWGVVVKTLGGVKGWIPKKEWERSDVWKGVDWQERMEVGKVVSYEVRKVEEERGQLLMKPLGGGEEEEGEVKEEQPKEEKKKKRKLEEESESTETPDTDKKKRKRRGKAKKKKRDRGVAAKAEEEEETVKMEDEESVEVDEEVKPGLPDIPGSFWQEEDTPAPPPAEEPKPTKKSVKKDAAPKSTETEEAAAPDKDAALVASYEKQGLRGECGKLAHTAHFWLRLMTHYQENRQPERVRQVAREALDHGPIAQQPNLREALKIWGKWFAFTLKYDPDSLEGLVREAISRTDKKRDIYQSLAHVYASAGKLKEAERVLRERLLKECGEEVDAWVTLARFYFENHQNGQSLARDVFHQAGKTKLVNNPHFLVNLTYRFASLELHHGDSDKAREMMATVLLQHPKRVDIWAVWVQALVKREMVEEAREAFLEFFGKGPWKLGKVRGMINHWRKMEEVKGSEESREKMKEVLAKVLLGGRSGGDDNKHD